MVIREFYRKRDDGVDLHRSYSNEGLQIRKLGTDEIYDEAIDIDGASYIYEETDGQADAEATVEDYRAALREMGVAV